MTTYNQKETDRLLTTDDSLKLSGSGQLTTIPAVGPFIEVPPAFQLSVETVPPATNQPVPAKYDSEKTAALPESTEGCTFIFLHRNTSGGGGGDVIGVVAKAIAGKE